MYRSFIEKKDVEIKYNGSPLKFNEPIKYIDCIKTLNIHQYKSFIAFNRNL